MLHGTNQAEARMAPKARSLTVREMLLPETELIVDYFLRRSTHEYLNMLGIDPARMPPAAVWQEGFRREYDLPLDERTGLFVIWLCDGATVGFSSCDTIVLGESAHMHLHVSTAERRRQGIGTECLRRSIDFYFDRLRLQRLYCQPNAFNIAPNRTLQKAGFKYLDTRMAQPGPINHLQPVTRWIMER
jgi:RimJ/RimL family protein N-acetyltransferase